MDTNEQIASRIKTIILTSIIGIAANCLLAGFKAVVGFVTGSIAITMDAVNNLSDALSSVITIVGTKIAAKKPDKKHPYGHGRVEYLTEIIIAIIVMYAGATSLIESVKKILYPETADYSVISLVIVAVAVLVKILLGLYVKKKGKDVHSDSLADSGQDALLDAVISTTTLIAALLYIFAGLSLEAYLAAIISVIIIKAGVDMLRSAISQILGERAQPELTLAMKQTICEFEGVVGAYDLVMNNYGPDTYMASVHVEVDGSMTASEIDTLTRRISDKIFHTYQVILVAVGIYALNKDDAEANAILDDIRTRLEKYPDVMQMHGFFINKKEKNISFDVIVDFSSENRLETHKKIKQEIREAYPDYHVSVTLDQDFSD